MDSHRQAIENINRQFELQRIQENIKFAKIRCLSTDEIIQRLDSILVDPLSGEVISRLQELDLTLNEQKRVAEIILTLITVSEKLPYREKAKSDRLLRRMVKVLRDQDAYEIALLCLASNRKSRRDIAYSALKNSDLSPFVGQKLLDRFRETGDQFLLEVLVRHPNVIPELDFAAILDAIEETYWRMRVFEALIPKKLEDAINLSDKYPFEFVYAAGRLKDRQNLPFIKRLLEENKSNLDFLSIYVWALGKLGDMDELNRVEAIITGWK